MPIPELSVPLDTVRVLAAEIGPRGSTTANERRASEWVAARLQERGFAVSVEPFRAVATFSYAYGVLFGLFVLAALVYPAFPPVAVFLSLVALIGFGLEASNIDALTRFLPHGDSQNVVGVLPAREQARRKIVLTAHLDSSRSALLWHPRIRPYFRPIFLLLVAAMVAEFLLYALGLVTRAGWVWTVSLTPAVLILAATLIFIDRELRYKHTAGANDNASGVAVMLAVADQIARAPLDNAELVVAATGCEESGTFGALHLLRAHDFDRSSTLFINFDNIGAGRVSYVTGEGLLLTLRADAELVAAARGAVASDPALDAQEFIYKILTTDNTVFLNKGYRGISLMAFDRRGLLPNWHWHTDTVENVNPGTLECAVALATAMVRRLDGE